MDITNIGLVDDDDILLDIAALALSQLDHGEADLQPYLAQLDEIEDLVCAEGRSAFLSGERAAVLLEVMHQQLGFAGDSQAYDAPINADLVRVLDRKRGLPISLAILYVAMARRAGWTADVLNVPGHVLVRIGEKNPVVIDPFMGHGPVSADDLEVICCHYLGDDGKDVALQVEAMSNRQILTRLLNNQAIRAEQGGDLPHAFAVYSRITQVAPDGPEAWQNLARLHLAFEDVPGARHCLLAMLEVVRDPDLRSRIKATHDALASASPPTSEGPTLG